MRRPSVLDQGRSEYCRFRSLERSSRIREVTMASTTAAQPKLLSFTEARQAVEEYASRLSPTEPEMLSLLDAVGLVLAEDLRADRDFPPFRRSTRDGYAVRAADAAAVPTRLHLIGEIKAGASSEQSGITIGAGETAEIMTGAPVPPGADAVVMVEYTERKRRSRHRPACGGGGRQYRCRRFGSHARNHHGGSR